MLKKLNWKVLWRPTRPFRTNTQKRCPLHYRSLPDPMNCSLPGSSVHGICQARVLEWGAIAFSVHYRAQECKSRKSRTTWSNRQIWPWSMKWSRAKANRILPREHTGHSKHPLSTTQEKTLYRDITRWSTPKSDWLHSLQPKMEKLYTVSKNKTGSWLWLRSLLPNSDLNWRKWGKPIDHLGMT